jgi:hypothetical protein
MEIAQKWKVLPLQTFRDDYWRSKRDISKCHAANTLEIQHFKSARSLKVNFFIFNISIVGLESSSHQYFALTFLKTQNKNKQ